MSQHKWVTEKNGKKVEVLAGYDRPLKGFFMVVTAIDESDGESEYLYNNLFQEDSWPQSFDPFQSALDELELELPVGMREDIEQDMSENRGNKYVDWNEKVSAGSSNT